MRVPCPAASTTADTDLSRDSTATVLQGDGPRPGVAVATTTATVSNVVDAVGSHRDVTGGSDADPTPTGSPEVRDGSGAPDAPRWPRWFLVVGTILGVIYAVTIPVSRPLDEPHHIRRVATLDRGVIVPPDFGTTGPDYRVDGCVEALVDRATADFGALIEGTPQRLTRADRWKLRVTNPACEPDAVLHGGGSISGAEVNSPVPYVPAMIGYAIGRPLGGALGAVYGARLVQLAAYLVICWWALRRLPWGRPFAAAVALVPTAIGGASGVSADPMTLALTLAAVAVTLSITRGVERRARRVPRARDLAVLSGLFVLLGLCKPAAAPLVLLAVIVPTAAFGTVRRRVAWVAATIGAVAVTGGAWALAVSSRVHVTTTPGVDSTVTAAWLNHHLWTLPLTLWRTLAIPEASRYLLGGVVTPLGLDVLEVPVVVTLAGIAVLVIARLVDPLPRRFAHLGSGPVSGPVRPRRRQLRLERFTAVVIAGCGLTAVTYGIYVASNPPDSSVISGIQGRYFLPYVLLLLVGVRPTPAGRGTPRLQAAVLIGLVLLNVYWLGRLYWWWQLV
jgi:hypothetical protein